MKIVRGKNECKSGEELINKLDMRIANDNRLHKKISFSILKDPVSSGSFIFTFVEMVITNASRGSDLFNCYDVLSICM